MGKFEHSRFFSRWLKNDDDAPHFLDTATDPLADPARVEFPKFLQILTDSYRSFLFSWWGSCPTNFGFCHTNFMACYTNF